MSDLLTATAALVEATGEIVVTKSQLLAWATGDATGGPNNDGRYPFSAADGSTVPVTSPARINAGKVATAASRLALAAHDVAGLVEGTTALLGEGARAGMFVWRSGNYGPQVAVDAGEGMFIRHAAIAPTMGVWQRASTTLRPEYFGALGDGVTDDTLAFARMALMANFIARGVVVELDGVKTYRIGQQAGDGVSLRAPILTHAYANLVGLTIRGNGATIKLNDGMLFGSFNADGTPTAARSTSNANRCAIGTLLGIYTCSYVTIENLVLDGNIDGVSLGNQWGDTGYQIEADGLRLDRCQNYQVTNVAARNCGRDGLYLWGKGDRRATGTLPVVRDRGKLTNCAFDGNARQGVSIVAGRGILFEVCDFINTGQGRFSSAPAAGVDVEPNGGYWACDIQFEGCNLSNNLGQGLLVPNNISNNILWNGGTVWAGFAPLDGVTKGSQDTFYFATTSAESPSRYVVQNAIIHGAMGQMNAGRFADCVFDDAVHPIYGASGQNRPALLNNMRGRFRDSTFTVTSGLVLFNSPSGTITCTIEGCTFIYAGTKADGSQIGTTNDKVRFRGKNTVMAQTAPATGYFIKKDAQPEIDGTLTFSNGVYLGGLNGVTGNITPTVRIAAKVPTGATADAIVAALVASGQMLPA